MPKNFESFRAPELEDNQNQDPASRFNVDPARYPILARQGNVHKETLDIRETLGLFTRNTADLVATIDGTGEDIENPPIDHVIYLDKSARPVSWLVNTFWQDFSDKERPPHSYLAIDRKNWFNRAGVETTTGQYIINPDGSSDRLASFTDFEKVAEQNITRSQLARIRAMFLRDGIESSPSIESRETDFSLTAGANTGAYAEVERLDEADVDKIFASPTVLDGKNILIVDEVGRSGSTVKIAKWLLERAVPEVKDQIYTTYFWPTILVGNEPESSPVWYDSNSSYGRGIGDIDRVAQIKRYLKYRDDPNLASKTNLNKMRAQLIGYIARGTAVDLSAEPAQKSRELMREIKLMKEDYDTGRILMPAPLHWDKDKYCDYVEALGVEITPDPTVKNSLASIIKTFQKNRRKSY